MTGLLTNLTQRLCPDPAPAEYQTTRNIPEADPENYGPRGRTTERHQDAHRTWSAPRPASPPRDRHPSAPPPSSPRQWHGYSAASNNPPQQGMFTAPASRNISEVDPFIARPGFRPHRDFPASLQGLEEDADLSTRVATLLSAGLAPLAHSTGKKHFAHSFIARGNKRSRTTLGDLSIPEYSTGFIRLINHHDTPTQNKPDMFRHLEHVNEDAIIYEWEDVRAWSEEICTLVAESKLRWSDEYRIDILRLKLSQRNPKSDSISTPQAASKDKKEAATGDVSYPLSNELRAAKPGPPCKHYNAGTCAHSSDHVINGYRQLHICAHCLSTKCMFWPHGEKGCRTKDFNKRRVEQGAGFGK